jgi:hypothetical protein
VVKKVIRIFKKCADCPFCVDKHIKEATGYGVKYVCIRSEYKEINMKELLVFPDWCPLEEETIMDFTQLKSEIK